MGLNKVILKKIKDKSLSVRAASETSGVPYSSLQRFLSGEGDLPSRHLESILNLLKIDLSYVVENYESLDPLKGLPVYIKNSILRIISKG